MKIASETVKMANLGDATEQFLIGHGWVLITRCFSRSNDLTWRVMRGSMPRVNLEHCRVDLVKS